jgi:hypothetical protein
LAKDRDLHVIVTASGESGMPQDAEGRVANASRMIDAALAKSIPIEKLYVDGLVFPFRLTVSSGTTIWRRSADCARNTARRST